MPRAEFVVNDVLDVEIRSLGHKMKISPGDVILRAIALYKFCHDQIKNGRKIVTVNAQGVPVKELVFD